MKENDVIKEYEIAATYCVSLAMTEKMDSRFRGNDRKKCGNDEGRRDCRALKTVLVMTLCKYTIHLTGQAGEDRFPLSRE